MSPVSNSRRQLLERGLMASVLSAWPALGSTQQPPPAAAEAARSIRTRDWFTDTTLRDQDHQTHALYSDLLAPRTVLINAAFVGCSSACPLITQHLVRTRDALGDRFGTQVWFLSITVDPLNDGPDELKRFAQRQGADGPGWRFLTGKPNDVQTVLQRLGLWPDKPDNHQTGLVAGNARGGRWGKLRPDSSPQALAQQLARFIHAG
jgi:protein SCO1